MLKKTSLQASEQFTKFIPSVIVFLGYGIAFYCLSLTLKTIPIGIVYAIWSGVGLVLITLIGKIVYHQSLDLAGQIGIGLILVGILVINLFSQSSIH